MLITLKFPLVTKDQASSAFARYGPHHPVQPPSSAILCPQHDLPTYDVPTFPLTLKGGFPYTPAHMKQVLITLSPHLERR